MVRTLGWLGILSLMSICPVALAETAIWNGTSGNWSDATRWSTDPDFPNNDATTYDVEVGAGTLTQDVAGGVTVDSLTWSGGTLSGSEPLAVRNSVIWTDGSLANSGGLVVPAGGTLQFSGNGTQHKLDDDAIVTVGGTFVLLGSSELNTSAAVGNGAMIQVLDGAVFDIQGYGNLTDTFFNNVGQVRQGTLSNSGTLQKSAGSATSLVTDDWTVDNLPGATLEVLSGTLLFSRDANGLNNDGLAHVAAGVLQVGGGTSTGTFQVDPGGTLWFATHQSSPSIAHLLDGATIENNGLLEIDGRVRFTNGATVTGNAAVSLVGDGAEIGGSSPLAFDQFTWTAGILANSGGVTINSGGTLTISGSGGKQLADNALLSVSGTATLAGSQSIVNLASAGAPAQVDIGPGGIFELQSDVGFSESPITVGSNQGALIVDGTLRKTGGSGNSDVSVDWQVENNGEIEVGSGTIRFFGEVTQNGTVDLSGGNVEFRGNVVGDGNFTGAGLATFRRDYRPGASPAEISFEGDLQFSTSAANLLIEIGGTADGQYDQLLVSGTAELAGSLRVDWIDLGSGLFAPAAGDVFEVISAEDGITGAFTPFLPALSDGLVWKVVKSSTSLSLMIEAANSNAMLGDYNSDGTVNAADYTVWRNSFGQAGAGLAADGNEDDVIDDLDYSIWKSHFGESVPAGLGAGAATVVSASEPSAICLCMIGAMLFAHSVYPARSLSIDD